MKKRWENLRSWSSQIILVLENHQLERPPLQPCSWRKPRRDELLWYRKYALLHLQGLKTNMLLELPRYKLKKYIILVQSYFLMVEKKRICGRFHFFMLQLGSRKAGSSEKLFRFGNSQLFRHVALVSLVRHHITLFLLF